MSHFSSICDGKTDPQIKNLQHHKRLQNVLYETLRGMSVPIS